jgi:hypothetical protein
LFFLSNPSSTVTVDPKRLIVSHQVTSALEEWVTGVHNKNGEPACSIVARHLRLPLVLLLRHLSFFFRTKHLLPLFPLLLSSQSQNINQPSLLCNWDLEVANQRQQTNLPSSPSSPTLHIGSWLIGFLLSLHITTNYITMESPRGKTKSPKSGKEAAPPKKASTRVKNQVNYDEKRHLTDLEDDIQHGVAHRTINELEEHVNDLGDSWETDSLFQDALEDLTEDKIFNDGKVALTFYLFQL